MGTLAVTDLQTAYDEGADGVITVDATRGAVVVRDAAVSIAADLFAVQSNAPANLFGVHPTTGVSLGLAARRTAVATYASATGRGTLELQPDNITATAAPPLPGILQWDSTYTTDFAFNNFGGVLNAIGTHVHRQAGFAFNHGLIFNNAIIFTNLSTAAANFGPTFTLVDQPLIQADTQALTQSIHNSVRSQPRFSAINGGSLVVTNLTHYESAGTVTAGVTVTTRRILRAGNFATFSGTLGTNIGLDIDTFSQGTTNIGIRSNMTSASGTFIQNTGTAPSTFAGAVHMNNGVRLALGTQANNRVELFRSSPGIMRMIGAGGTNNEGLDWNFDSNPNNVAITSPTSAGLNLDVIQFAIGPSTIADGTNNWFMAFVPGLRSTQLAGDYSEVLFTSASSIQVAHAISNFATWTVNAPSIAITSGSVTNAANVLIQTNMGQGTNRYGLLVTSSPSGGTLNYCARFQGAAGVRIDGSLFHAGTTLGFYGTAPVAQSAAYTVTNHTPDRTYDANASSVAELADVLGTLLLDLIGNGMLQGSVT